MYLVVVTKFWVVHILLPFFLQLEPHVAESRWTQKSRGLGFIPTALVMCKSLGQALNPHSLYPASSNGYQVDRKLVLYEWLHLYKTLSILLREMKL